MTKILRPQRLVPAFFRFIREDVVRSRRVYFAVSLVALALALAMVSARAGSEPGGFGPLFILGLLIISAPFCRSWLDEDVRLGYAAFWLQKPVTALELYLARLIALVVWSGIAVTAVGLSTLPAVLFTGVSVESVVQVIAGLGWITPILVVLAFLGSALGARNGALFAYGFLFAGFALPGFRDSLQLGSLYDALEVLFPPTSAGLDVNEALRQGHYGAALRQMRPLLTYALGCAALALALAVQVPNRLTRTE